MALRWVYYYIYRFFWLILVNNILLTSTLKTFPHVKECPTIVIPTSTSSSHTTNSFPESSEEIHGRYNLIFKRISLNDGDIHDTITQVTKVTVTKRKLTQHNCNFLTVVSLSMQIINMTDFISKGLKFTELWYATVTINFTI